MSDNQLDIADMQCWVFRIAQKRWKLSAKRCAEIFAKYNIMGFISDCYDILHLSSYDCVVDEVERLLRNKGAKLC